MFVRLIRNLGFLLVSFCLVFTASACTLDGLFAPVPSDPTPSIIKPAFQVDPVFKDLYRTLGSAGNLGPIISPAFTENEKTCQFSLGVKMCYDPRRKAAQQLFLEPLGLSLNLKEPPMDNGDSTDPLVIDGYMIDPEFIPALQKLQLTRFAGRPISHVLTEDSENGRKMQLFENIGFFIRLNDPERIVHPVAYGYMVCDVCKKNLNDIPEDAMPSTVPHYIEPFKPQLNRLGTELPGRPISVYYQTDDGYYSQIYENVVVQSPEGGPVKITFLDLTRRVIDADIQFAYFQPVAPIDDPSLVFHEERDGMGFNEVRMFDEYVANHGGRDMSGEVISERFTVGNLYRQCYENYCLDYNPDDGSIRPAPLGKIYLEKNPPVAVAVENLVLTPDKIFLRTWVKQDIISSIEKQIVFMLVVQYGDQSPIPNLTSTLKLYLPDGSTREYRLPSTDESGQAYVDLEPIDSPNGKIIPYTVCLDIDTNYMNCVKESFMIWGNP